MEALEPPQFAAAEPAVQDYALTNEISTLVRKLQWVKEGHKTVIMYDVPFIRQV